MANENTHINKDTQINIPFLIHTVDGVPIMMISVILITTQYPTLISTDKRAAQ